MGFLSTIFRAQKENRIFDPSETSVPCGRVDRGFGSPLLQLLWSYRPLFFPGHSAKEKYNLFSCQEYACSASRLRSHAVCCTQARTEGIPCGNKYLSTFLVLQAEKS